MSEAVTRLHEADAALAAESTPFHLPIGAAERGGLDAVVAGSVTALSRGDWWVPGLRERAGAVLRDVPVDRLTDGFRGARPYKVAPPSAAPALRALTAVGLALAAEGQVALVHLGTGSVADGAFTEALNLAALHAAPVVFVVAVHPLTDSEHGPAPLPPQTAGDAGAVASALAGAFGVPVHFTDGADEAAVHAAVTAAREAALADAGGPQLVLAPLHT